MEVVTNMYTNYKWAMSRADPRTRDWFLVWNSPLSVVSLCAAYVFMVLYGKRYMRTRKEVVIPTSILFTYNMSLVILSIYMFYELIVGTYQSNYNFLCQRLTDSTAPSDMRVAAALWIYFVSKAVEFMDTIFMVIRKKFNQITFLHCFHHSSMLFIWWGVIMYLPGGQSYFGATINSLIHIFMYTYYALAAIPSMREKLWWKKYITTCQLIQFGLTFLHTVYGFYNNCGYPKWGLYCLMVYMIIMIILFTNFYTKEYIQKAKLKAKLANGSANKKKTDNDDDDEKTKKST